MPIRYRPVSHALAHALAHARRRFDTARARGLRVPSVRVLAAEAKVGHVTMWKATRALRDERAGVATPPQPIPPPVALPAWVRTRDHISADLAAGRLPYDEPLPVAKALCARYAVGAASVVSALRALHADGLLVRRRRAYYAWRPGIGASGTDLPLYTHTTPSGGISDTTPRFTELVRALESQCAQHGLRLDIRPFERVARSRGDMGAIVCQVALERRRLGTLCRTLACEGRPLAVIDESGDVEPATTAYGQAVCWLRFADGSAAGEAVGEHLAALGHRRAAYFAVLRADDPSVQQRHVALERTLSRAKGSLTIRSAGMARAQLEREMAGLKLARAWKGMRAKIRAHVPHTLRDAAQVFGDRTALAAMVHEVLAPMLESELAAGYTTGWAFYNDLEALVAMAWLRDNGIEVPRRVSLVGTDDAVEALHNGLSSYSFNAVAVARAAVHHLVAPRRSTGACAAPGGAALTIRAW